MKRLLTLLATPRRLAMSALALGAIAPTASGDFTGFSTVRSVSNGLVKYEVLANFNGPTDTVLNAFHITLVEGTTSYFHTDSLTGGSASSVSGSWNPISVSFIGALDSYVCIGGGEGFASGNSTAADFDWGAAGFNTAQIPYGNFTAGPGWFNQNPPNLQGRVNANGQVKLAQFTISSVADVVPASIFLKMGYNNGQGGGVLFGEAIFELGGADCNQDGQRDTDQIAEGTLTDCDGDWVPDICEGAEVIEREQSFPFATATPVEVVFTDLPRVFAGTPRVEIEATADLGAANDALIVQLDGGAGATLFLADGRDCPPTPDIAIIERSLEDFAALIADGELRVRVSGFGVVNTANCPNGGIVVRLVYATIAKGSDCNENGQLDSCEIATGTAADCDNDGVVDECQLASGVVEDCNQNGVPDGCDIASGVALDLDGNGIPDECSADDCDGDGVPDEDELAAGLDSDCDGNGRIDWCDLLFGASDDNGNGRLDSCEFARGDFNLDGFVNGADLAPLLSLWGLSNPPIGDLNGDGLVGGADLSILLGNWGALAWQPVLSRAAPREGPANGGTVVILEGAGLGSATAVRFGGIDAWSITTIDDSSVSVVAPARDAGLVGIEMVTTAGSVTVPSMFRYLPANLTTPAWATLVEAEPNPAVVYDADLRAAILATGWAWKVRDNGTGIEMLLIPPGTYDMGCSASNQYGCAANENPVHPVTITQPFYMSRTEVTQAQWTAVMGSNPSYFQGASVEVPASEVPNRPVEQVSWNTIQGFLSATGMRLPTEAEWEYAYRAGTTTAFHGWAGQPAGTNDDSLVGNIAWYSSNSSSPTRPVGGKAANGFGLHDMAGNVSEWVSDWYSGSYYASSPLEDPQGPTSGSDRVLRGGSWVGVTYIVRSSYRVGPAPGSTDSSFGFRVARGPL